jgi:hypothetical protein
MSLVQMEDKICRVARFSFLLSGTKTSSDLWNMEIHLMSAQYSTNRGKVFLPNSECWQSLSSESGLFYLFFLYYTAKSGKPSFRKRQSLSSTCTWQSDERLSRNRYSLLPEESLAHWREDGCPHTSLSHAKKEWLA